MCKLRLLPAFGFGIILFRKSWLEATEGKWIVIGVFDGVELEVYPVFWHIMFWLYGQSLEYLIFCLPDDIRRGLFSDENEGNEQAY